MELGNASNLKRILHNVQPRTMGHGISVTEATAASKYQKHEEQADRKSTRLNSSHSGESRMPSSA